MRTSLAATSADRMSSSITWISWGLAGAFFTLVALPLASSSPYPTPDRPDWSIQPVSARMALASASPFALASVESVPLVTAVKTVSIRRPIGDDAELGSEYAIVTASIGDQPTREPPYPQRLAVAPPSTDDAARGDAPRNRATANEIDDYLWEVYQRQPAKRDRGGDFTWKDPAAANRMGKSLQAYVIAGMDADFRELVYHAGKAMDAAGVEWTIVSGFRDDWRQSIASGLKARTGFSRHGGSRAVGGYGHGRAVDIGHVDRERNELVWRWVDNNGAKYGLHRPHRFDPPHVEPRIEWRRLASALRRERVGAAAVAAAETRELSDDARPAASRKSRGIRVAHARTGRPARNGRRHN